MEKVEKKKVTPKHLDCFRGKNNVCIYVMDWGYFPLFTEKRNGVSVHIPNGYRFHRICDGLRWVGETNTENGIALYRFTLCDDNYMLGREELIVRSAWFIKPGLAYADALRLIDHPKRAKIVAKLDGNALTGLFTPDIQARVRQVYGLLL